MPSHPDITTSPIILSLFIGKPKDLGTPSGTDWHNKPWRSAIFKESTTEPIHLDTLGHHGDGVQETKFHGGPDKALLAYPANHYTYWQQQFPDTPSTYGWCGENWTLSNLDETQACIGDTFIVGSATVQISQPRQPCWKLSRRWQIKSFVREVQRLGYNGFYLRVLQPGTVQVGDTLTLTDRPHPNWPTRRVHELLYDRSTPPELLSQLSALELLSTSTRSHFERRLQHPYHDDSAKRLKGENGT
ncbi:MOSC domain-containing protein [Poriferisphaera sp. WC338]|uniref:MOSC domain-containing protein n=1 Tax=Poriferisphaera sp. WC338 TaxID=3425129 RepID=UPI003D817B53